MKPRHGFAGPFGDDPTSGRGEDLRAYKRLTWDDYRVDDRIDGLDARTQGRVKYEYRIEWRQERDGYAVRVTSLIIRSYFDAGNSWRRSRLTQPDQLLVHEQGHLDISHSTALQLMRLRPDDFPPERAATLDEARQKLEERLRKRFEDALEEARQRQIRYDIETRHGINVEAQAAWTRGLRRELDELARATPPGAAAGSAPADSTGAPAGPSGRPRG